MVDVLSIAVVVNTMCIMRLLEGYRKMVESFGIKWVQLSDYKYFFPFHLVNPLDSVAPELLSALCKSTELYDFDIFCT